MCDREARPVPPTVAGVSDSYARGLRLFTQGHYEQALAMLGPLADRADLPGVMARFYRGLCQRELGVRALNEGRLRQAERHLKSALAALGRRGDLYGYLASVYAGTFRYEACAGAAEKAARYAAEDSPTMHRRRAQALWQASRRCEAYMELTGAMRRLGRRKELLVQLGLFYGAEDRHGEARAAFAEAAELDRSDGDVHYYLGLAAAADGDPSAAATALQRSVELRGGDVLATYQLALAAKAAADCGAGAPVRVPEPAGVFSPAGSGELARYVAREPDFVEAFLSLPACDADEQLFALLAEVLETALSEHPNYADLHRSMARVLDRLGRGDEAEAHARRAVRINPDYLAARLDLAEMCRRSGRTEEALSHVRRVLDGGGDWPDVHRLAGRLLKDSGRDIDARRHLLRAVELNPNYREAIEALESLAA